MISCKYHIYPEYWDGQTSANSVDSEQMLQNAASDQGLHCVQLVQQFLDMSSSSKIELFKF